MNVPYHKNSLHDEQLYVCTCLQDVEGVKEAIAVGAMGYYASGREYHTAIFEAVLRLNPEICRLLLPVSDANHIDKSGLNALSLLATQRWYGKPKAAEEKSLEIFKALVGASKLHINGKSDRTLMGMCADQKRLDWMLVLYLEVALRSELLEEALCRELQNKVAVDMDWGVERVWWKDSVFDSIRKNEERRGKKAGGWGSVEELYRRLMSLDGRVIFGASGKALGSTEGYTGVKGVSSYLSAKVVNKTPLGCAISQGFTPGVQMLIDMGVDLSVREPVNDNTYLMQAIEKKNLEICQLVKGSSPSNSKSSSGISTIELANRGGLEEVALGVWEELTEAERIEIAPSLCMDYYVYQSAQLEVPKNTSALSGSGELQNRTLFQTAISYLRAPAIIKKINLVRSKATTEFGFIKITSRLPKSLEDGLWEDDRGDSALSFCIKMGFDVLTTPLMTDGWIQWKNSKGQNLITKAVMRGRRLAWLKKGRCVWFSPLAAHGIDPNEADASGRNPLHWAALEGDEVAVSELVELCDINEPTHEGDTALMLAVRGASLECVQMLMNKGAQWRTNLAGESLMEIIDQRVAREGGSLLRARVISYMEEQELKRIVSQSIAKGTPIVVNTSGEAVEHDEAKGKNLENFMLLESKKDDGRTTVSGSGKGRL